MNTIYTIGYHAPGAMQKVEELVSVGARIIDIRLVPGSRYYPEWTRKALEMRFHFWRHYERLPALDNLNYHPPSRPMQLQDQEAGLAWLETFAHQHPLILLYGCSDYRRCHRLLVCTLFKQRVPAARIVHLVSHPAITPQWEEHLHGEEVQP